MALPSASDLTQMTMVYRGMPFCFAVAKSTIDTTSSAITYRGMIFAYAPSVGVITPPTYDAAKMFAMF